MDREVFFGQGKRFFFDDKKKISQYVMSNCQREAEHVIRTADDVVRQEFLFDLRWDMERTSRKVYFEHEIDWLSQPDDDPEWIFAFNRMRFWICLGQAYAMTQDEKYAKCFASQLQHWVRTVRREDPRCAKAWRTIEAGIRMEYWSKAILYFADSPSLTAEVMDTFITSLTDHAEFIMDHYDSYNLMSNWGVLANHGLFIASVLLPESSRTLEYQKEALRRLEQEISIQVYDDGSQWEQSPLYHNEVAHDFLDVVILARRNHIDLPRIIEEKTKKMCLASSAWQLPNGNEPINGDSDAIDQRDIVTKGAVLFNDTALLKRASPDFDFDTIWDIGWEERNVYLGMRKNLRQATSGDTELSLLPDSGNAYFRNGGGYVHFHCGTLGAGHGHGDQLHVDWFANGEDILVDSGRFTYVPKPERYEFKDCTAHNTTIVDHENFYVCADSWMCTKLSESVNFEAKAKKNYGYAQGGHLGYFLIGVFVNRKIISLGKKLLLICDEFYAQGKHDYTQYLHFNDSFTVENPQSANSNLNKVSLRFIGKGLCQEVVASRMSRHYNQASPTRTIVTTFIAKDFASLFTVLALGDEEVCVQKKEVRSNFKGIVFPDEVIEGLTISNGDQKYTVVVSHQEYASPTDTFLCDGCTGFGRAVVFDRSEGEDVIGTVLKN